ncbi:MAG TPA: PAS domain-containing protein [Rhodocyclaceae bacterium]|nr:PAS domain-containing protein [Rhodocyclaceae bacterium]
MKYRVQPNDREKTMRESDFIVSKTDLQGRIAYGNRIFIEFSGYTEAEPPGAQHDIIRHPDMPCGVFKFLRDTLQAEKLGRPACAACFPTRWSEPSGRSNR